MAGAAFLRGDRLTLRTVEPADYEFVHRHWNDPEVRRGFARSTPRTREDVAEFFEESDDESVHFVACVDGERVGFVWLFEIDDVAGRAELGYWVAPDEQGNGYATELADLAVRYAFDDRGLRKVSARVFEWNDASRRVLERTGFRQEGHLRDHYYVDGERVDASLYGLLRTEE
ncbi:GNAT family N-acetyltransferase [Halorussus sp. AFM4]|uniref:GNAT family N-acetyltransferase n=1 Tax=Halorussus sp. AFM4 TaxID=3421651 RepID=UPI003EB85183